MFKVKTIEIDGFWHEYKAKSQFKEDVNIIIGNNGTGKTTFMNIMHAVLAVDIDALYENFFKTVTITLVDGAKNRTISAKRIELDSSPFPIIEYRISNKKYIATLVSNDDARTYAPSLRRRAAEEAQQVKNKLSEMVSLASLSVYRLGGDIDPEIRDRSVRRNISTVDQRLSNLSQRLTQYQLELSNEARHISGALQRDVLTSLLYSKSDARRTEYQLDINTDKECQNLMSTYRQLGVSGPEVTRKIFEHVSAFADLATKLKLLTSTRSKGASEGIDFSALEAFRRTRAVVDLSLKSEEKIKAIFSQIELFLTKLKDFMPAKKFSFEAGDLKVKSKDAILLSKLSSGEKQLLILFIEALLQKQRPYIFLADEPELSLHISWQREIISAITSINPNAQIIVATHSPEIAGKYRSAILDMEDIRNV
jgi:ABC-type lipoprotein export system ATPase subunit